MSSVSIPNLYNNKTFRALSNSPNGQVSSTTRFHYHQEGRIVWAEYGGGSVQRGSLIATVQADGSLDMRYQHVDVDGVLRTGKCVSTPEVLEDGRTRLVERWEWTGEGVQRTEARGESVLEEVRGEE